MKMKLSEGKKGSTYTIQSVNGSREINTLLFSLGCFEGEDITLVKKLRSNYIINIKGGRYGVDHRLAEAIMIS